MDRIISPSSHVPSLSSPQLAPALQARMLGKLDEYITTLKEAAEVKRPLADVENTVQHAIALLPPLLRNVDHHTDLDRLYTSLLYLLPYFNEEQISELMPKEKTPSTTTVSANEEGYLFGLLNHSAHLHRQQKRLAEGLADWYIAHSAQMPLDQLLVNYHSAMHYLAKARQIEQKYSHHPRVDDLHRVASQLFSRVVGRHLLEGEVFKRKLMNLKHGIALPEIDNDPNIREANNPEIYRAQLQKRREKGLQYLEEFKIVLANTFEHIRRLEKFCYGEEDEELIRGLYRQIEEVRKDMTGTMELYLPPDTENWIAEGLAFTFNHRSPLPLVTQKYEEGLINFRKKFDQFDSENVREFQGKIATEFKNLIKIFLEDAYDTLGPPPCDYDIRAMGSFAREEVCPFSDLEVMVLFDHEDHRRYFENLLQLLELQIQSLGETSSPTKPPLTCLHLQNPSGLHLDGDPIRSTLETPRKMAEMQTGKPSACSSHENTVLKSISIDCSDNSLVYDAYLDALDEREREKAEPLRKKRAWINFEKRLEDYKAKWRSNFNSSHAIVNVKEDFIELINHLLTDISLFCGVDSANPLDIIHHLFEKEMLALTSVKLLSEVVSKIYVMRVTLHQLYGEQKDELCYGTVLPNSGFLWINEEEKLLLEKAYWLVLRPLYHCLEKVLQETPERDFPWEEWDRFRQRIQKIVAESRDEDLKAGTEREMEELYEEIAIFFQAQAGMKNPDEHWVRIVWPFYGRIGEIRGRGIGACEELEAALSEAQGLYRKLKFERVFHQLDLIKEALNMPPANAFSAKHFVPLIRHIAEESEEHIECYEALSKLEDEEGFPSDREDLLRKTYISTLEERGVLAEHFDQLALIPNSTGLRAIFWIQEERLRKQLEAITEGPYPDEPIQIMCPSYSEPRLLGRGVEILDREGNFIREEKYDGLHRVCRVQSGQYDLHFKEKPYRALMEYAVHNLTSRIAGDLTPPTMLARIQKGEEVYPVLISETVDGKKIDHKTGDPSKYDHRQWTMHLLCAIVTHPVDGRPSNYVEKEGRIYCVDNDMSLDEPVVKRDLIRDFDRTSWLKLQATEKFIVQFASVLFCLLPDTRLDREALEEFCSLDVEKVLAAWIDDVVEKAKQYRALFEEDIKEGNFAKLCSDPEEIDENKKKRFLLTTVFPKGSLSTLYFQFWSLQNYLNRLLNTNKDIQLYPINLLQRLVSLNEVFPKRNYVGGYVQEAYGKFMKYKDPQKRAEGFAGQLGLRSTSPSIAAHMFFGEIPDEEKKEYGPAHAREELPFLKAVDSQGSKEVVFGRALHYSEGGVIIHADFHERELDNEVRQPKFLRMLSGQCEQLGAPVSVTLRNCSALNATYLHPFLGENLISLDISGCVRIGAKEVVEIAGRCRNLKSLTLNGCTNLKRIIRLGAAPWSSQRLYFASLEHLEVSGCKNLREVRIEAPHLEFVGVSRNPNLTRVDLNTNPWVFGRVDLRQSPRAGFGHKTSPLEGIYEGMDHFYLYGALATRIKGGLRFRTSNVSLSNIDTIPPRCGEHIEVLTLSELSMSYNDIEGLISYCPNLRQVLMLPSRIAGRDLERLRELSALRAFDLGIDEVRAELLEKAGFFGALQWEKHFGGVGTEPPLPDDIFEILASSCPFWPDKIVAETHLLVLIPQTVNGAGCNENTVARL